MSKKVPTLIAVILVCIAARPAPGAKLGQSLQKQLTGLADSASVGVVIVSFDTDSGLRPAHLDALRGLGLTKGVTMERLGMVAVTRSALALKVNAFAARFAAGN